MSQTPDQAVDQAADQAVDRAADQAPDLESLPLAELRGYRQRLRDEEERVSYWRRLVHARTDLLEAGRSTDGSISFEDLVRVLGDTGTGAARTALLRVRAAEPLPDVPDLAGVWADVWVSPRSDAEVGPMLDSLRAAEQQLTGYRRALFARIDAAGVELVRRYRADPTLALAVLR